MRPTILLLLALAACPATDPPANDDDATASDDDDSSPETNVGSVLIVGAPSQDPAGIAGHLQTLLDADDLADTPAVEALTLPSPASQYIDEMTLMTGWYQMTGRDQRLAPMDGEWDHVVLADRAGASVQTPEFHFEGVHSFGAAAEAAGAEVHVLLESPVPVGAAGFEAAVENTWRVAEGVGASVVPAGSVVDRVDGADDWAIAAAVTLYASLRGLSASRSTEVPGGGDREAFVALADAALQVVEEEQTAEHYSGAFAGSVQLRSVTIPDTYWFMIAGTSSENGYRGQLQAFLDERGVAHGNHSLGQCNQYREVDAACLATAEGQFDQRSWVSLYARSYTVDADDILAAGAGEMQAQWYDRHWDQTSDDGSDALDDIEARMGWILFETKENGLAFIPHHAFFGRLKVEDPSRPLLRDGVHATDDVLYGLAAMSFVSATGESAALDSLDANRARIAEVAEDIVRQWATLQETPAR